MLLEIIENNNNYYKKNEKKKFVQKKKRNLATAHLSRKLGAGRWGVGALGRAGVGAGALG